GLINGILRQFQRQQDALMQHAADNNCRYLHPSWPLKRIQQAYPAQWEQIVDANNQKPPMWLRVNRLHHTREAYLQLMTQAGIAAEPHAEYTDALRLLTPCAVSALPGFADGWVTVQDA
ncbi:MAG: 16S rRNA (cytosine(967)-C(5))-methyltransferase, partial [Serratia symbiotica]|nr:16S rRNA (cytosine(967)-C(5))-methyltransferase [Serratia symbiotica]